MLELIMIIIFIAKGVVFMSVIIQNKRLMLASAVVMAILFPYRAFAADSYSNNHDEYFGQWLRDIDTNESCFGQNSNRELVYGKAISLVQVCDVINADPVVSVGFTIEDSIVYVGNCYVTN